MDVAPGIYVGAEMAHPRLRERLAYLQLGTALATSSTAPTTCAALPRPQVEAAELVARLIREQMAAAEALQLIESSPECAS